MAAQLGNNYPNPLDNYRTYSYHFVMTAASTTEAFRKMLTGSKSRVSSLVESTRLGDSFKVDDQNEAFLVLDTRRFPQYSVTNLDFEHIYGTGNTNNPTVPANTTKMTLVDSTGLSFFNFMMDLMREKLKSTRASAFFLLTIMFAGHTDDGQTEVIETCNIPLILLLMGFTFDHRGSVYEIEFMEIEGAPQRGGSMQQINNLGKISSISTQGKSNTLGSFIDDLETQLNKQSETFFQKYKNDALAGGNEAVGKLVQYMITIPDHAPNSWRDMKVTNAPKSYNKEKKFIAGKNDVPGNPEKSGESSASIQQNGQYSQLTFSPATTITDAIKYILETSDEFLELASEKNVSEGNGKAFKTITSITSDAKTFTVHFDIYPLYLPKPEKVAGKDTTVAAGSPTKDVIGNKNIVQNVIEYDYIFTGKNSHIKDLKIQYNPESAIALDTNLNIGNNRFAQNAERGNTSQGAAESGKGTAKTTNANPLIRPGDPIFIPLNTKDDQKNAAGDKHEDKTADKSVDSIKKKQEYTKTYSILHFLSSITMDVVIRGNPNIIKKYADRDTRGGIGPHVAKKDYYERFVKERIDRVEQKQSANKDPLLNGIDVSVLPVFMKLNIKAPNVDWTGQQKVQSDSKLPPEPMFTDSFFFDGPYQILFVKTTFNENGFEHLMTLLPYDISGSYTESKDSTSKK